MLKVKKYLVLVQPYPRKHVFKYVTNSMNSNLIVSNIKVSVKVIAKYKSLFNLKKQLCVKKENTSFYVFRKGTIVFCVYYKGHVNITGIRTLQQIQNCVDFLSVVPGVKTIQSVQVDNITCSAKLHEHIYTWNQSFRKYLQRLATNKNFLKIRYCPQTFPGAFLKLTKQGTIVFFATGKFNIVGCKSFTDIQDLVYKFLIAIKHLSS